MDGNEELMLDWSNHRPTLVQEVAALRGAVRYYEADWLLNYDIFKTCSINTVLITKQNL